MPEYKYHFMPEYMKWYLYSPKYHFMPEYMKWYLYSPKYHFMPEYKGRDLATRHGYSVGVSTWKNGVFTCAQKESYSSTVLGTKCE